MCRRAPHYCIATKGITASFQTFFFHPRNDKETHSCFVVYMLHTPATAVFGGALPSCMLLCSCVVRMFYALYCKKREKMRQQLVKGIHFYLSLDQTAISGKSPSQKLPNEMRKRIVCYYTGPHSSGDQK